jgi:hypothetical protein
LNIALYIVGKLERNISFYLRRMKRVLDQVKHKNGLYVSDHEHLDIRENDRDDIGAPKPQ